MKSIKTIQLKAAFLLVVFSLNMLVGFACSVGMDMGFNTHHHDEGVSSKDMSHHHDEIVNHNDSKDLPDNCCKDKVTKITQADKLVPQSYKSDFNLVFLTSFISTFYHAGVLPLYPESTPAKHFVRSTPPTIQDIRIAIQSFLI